jgi:hypothetical protein
MGTPRAGTVFREVREEVAVENVSPFSLARTVDMSTLKGQPTS